MFKSIKVLSLTNMSNERKVRETLAKKLCGKIIPKKIVQQVEQDAETQSSLFSEVKKKGKSNRSSKNIDKDLPKLRNLKGSRSSKNGEISTAFKVVEKKVRRNIKTVVDDSKSSLEVIDTNPSNVLKLSTKNKTTLEEESCSSKRIKEEVFEKWEPANWQIMLENVRNMRSIDKAPVDKMGCHKCADENADEKTQRFHKLVALMLSSQTKDETTYHAMLRLREHSLTPEVICNMKVNVLENILHPVSFYKNKAKYLQQTSKILVEKYNSDIPDNVKELIALPGVGPKMAHICMSAAWHQVTGIGVDVHVHRISNRIGWLQRPTKEPEQTRIALEAWLPRHLWDEVNYLLVGFGQTVCTPVKPKCSECLNCEICPSSTKSLTKDKSSEIEDITHKAGFKN